VTHLRKRHYFLPIDSRAKLDIPHSPAGRPVCRHCPVPRVFVQPPVCRSQRPTPAPAHPSRAAWWQATTVSRKHLHRLAGAYVPHCNHAFLRRDGKLGATWRECGAERRGERAGAEHLVRVRVGVERGESQLGEWGECDARAASHAMEVDLRRIAYREEGATIRRDRCCGLAEGSRE